MTSVGNIFLCPKEKEEEEEEEEEEALKHV
jgi:hypothetical protein